MRIRLTQGFYAVVDDDVSDRILRYRWKILRAGPRKIYAVRSNGEATLLMHREIAKAKRGFDVDHVDGDGLNNARSNLRVCTRSQNLANMEKTRGRSRFKGVYWNKEKGKWQAQIRGDVDGSVRYLGRFDDEVEAAIAYDRAAAEKWGEFARLNVQRRYGWKG